MKKLPIRSALLYCAQSEITIVDSCGRSGEVSSFAGAGIAEATGIGFSFELDGSSIFDRVSQKNKRTEPRMPIAPSEFHPGSAIAFELWVSFQCMTKTKKRESKNAERGCTGEYAKQ